MSLLSLSTNQVRPLSPTNELPFDPEEPVCPRVLKRIEAETQPFAIGVFGTVHHRRLKTLDKQKVVVSGLGERPMQSKHQG
jgi:hypothetical protein